MSKMKGTIRPDRMMQYQDSHIEDYEIPPYTEDEHTYNYEDIAVDLFPHGFSILLNYFGRQEINSFVWETSQHNFNCDFNYGHCHVQFDFHENSTAKKRLSLKLNDNLFERFQEGSGNTYTVYMKDMINGNHFYYDDPFKIYIKRFIKYCQIDKENKVDDYKITFANL